MNTLIQYRKRHEEHFKKLDSPNFLYGPGIKFNPEFDLDKINFKDMEIEVSSFKSNWDEEFIRLNNEDTIKDKLLSFHQSITEPVLIRIPDNTQGRLKISTKNNGFVTFLIIVGENCQLVIEELQSSLEKGYRGEIIKVLVKQNSIVDYKTFQDLNKETNNIVYRKVNLEKNASLNWLDAFQGSKFTRLQSENFLNGENSNSKVNSLFLGKEFQQFDISINSFHKEKNTSTNIVTKTILKDKSRSLVQGLIKIEENARFSNGFQREDALLLSEEAEANAIPNLEIENDEVSCKHASTIGRLDKDNLFYLQSKGLSEDQAKNLMIQGFLQKIIGLFDEDIKEKIRL